MNEVTVGLYLVCFAATCGAAIAFMWTTMTATLRELDKPIKRTYDIHPEMEDVKDGEELLVFRTFTLEEDTEEE
tara:strand:- start:390 stop:611 length:222 start_codon:yes stop_codon:yes gene_type:complete